MYYGHVRVDDGVRSEFESLVEQASVATSGIVDSAKRIAAVTSVAERFAPTETFESERALRVGGIDVELRHWGPGHTDGDVVVVVPSEGIVVAVGEGSSRCRRRPGSWRAASPQAVVTQRAYFERLREAMDQAVRVGRSRAEAVRLVPPEVPAERAQLLPINLGIMFDELDQ
jgi:hypothetical protein